MDILIGTLACIFVMSCISLIIILIDTYIFGGVIGGTMEWFLDTTAEICLYIADRIKGRK